MSADNIDVSPFVTTINGQLSKFMCKYFEEFHEYRNDVEVEELKTIWEKHTGIEIKEDVKKTKVRQQKNPSEEVKKCVAIILTGKRMNEACGAKVSKNSKTGMYCNRHIKNEGIGENKENKDEKEDTTNVADNTDKKEDVKNVIENTDRKDATNIVENDDLKNVIKTVLEITHLLLHHLLLHHLLRLQVLLLLKRRITLQRSKNQQRQS